VRPADAIIIMDVGLINVELSSLFPDAIIIHLSINWQ
jgi:hypothetical protein